MRYRGTKRQFVICVDNEGYAASLQRWKVYRALPDGEADAHGMETNPLRGRRALQSANATGVFAILEAA